MYRKARGIVLVSFDVNNQTYNVLINATCIIAFVESRESRESCFKIENG